jgi:hypothetical protein
VSAALISGVASADTNPFGATESPAASYLQLAEAEMACGANMKMDASKTAEKEASEKDEAAKVVEKKAADAAKTAAPKH